MKMRIIMSVKKDQKIIPASALCSCLIYQTLPDESGDYNYLIT